MKETNKTLPHNNTEYALMQLYIVLSLVKLCFDVMFDQIAHRQQLDQVEFDWPPPFPTPIHAYPLHYMSLR